MFKEDLQPTKFGKWFLGTIITLFLILSAIAKILSHFLTIIVIPIEWFFRHKIKALIKFLGFKDNFYSLLIVGCLSVMISQTSVIWIGGWRDLPNISLVGDILLVSPVILIVFSIWGLLARKYHYTIGEIFILTGALGVLNETPARMINYGISPFWAFLLSFIFFLSYGWVLTFPFWLIDFKTGSNKSKWRYVLAVVMPWLGIAVWATTIMKWMAPWILTNFRGGII